MHGWDSQLLVMPDQLSFWSYCNPLHAWWSCTTGRANIATLLAFSLVNSLLCCQAVHMSHSFEFYVWSWMWIMCTILIWNVCGFWGQFAHLKLCRFMCFAPLMPTGALSRDLAVQVQLSIVVAYTCLCERRYTGFPDEWQAAGSYSERNVHIQDSANAEPWWRY